MDAGVCKHRDGSDLLQRVCSMGHVWKDMHLEFALGSPLLIMNVSFFVHVLCVCVKVLNGINPCKVGVAGAAGSAEKRSSIAAGA